MFNPEQLQWAAAELGWQLAHIEALALQEIGDKKPAVFRYKGRDIPKILFERHVFWKQLQLVDIDPREVLRINPSAAAVLAQTPFPRYGRYITQYERRAKAMEIHREAAFAACSVSTFQIMGYHFAKCGYESAEAFSEAMTDPDNHLPALVAFIKSEKLQGFLQRNDFEGFAERYNGAHYYKSGYHIKLAKLYQQCLAKTLPKHDSVVVAAVNSRTIRRGAGAVMTAAAPSAAVLGGSSEIGTILDTARQTLSQTAEIKGQITELQGQAAQLAGLFDWLPWAAGGWSILLLLIFGLLVHRYLADRGYL